MKNTPTFRALIAKRLRDPARPKINQSEIAEAMGYGKAWMTKVMNGTIQDLDDEQVTKLEKILGIKFQTFREKIAASPFAREIEAKMNDNPGLAKVIEAVLAFAEEPPIWTPRYIDPSDMNGLGQKIIRIAQADQDKPGKVAREVLKLLG
jgi:hypothetical protein